MPTNKTKTNSINFLAQLARVAEYTICFSAEGLDFLNECPGYDTIQSDAETPLTLKL